MITVDGEHDNIGVGYASVTLDQSQELILQYIFCGVSNYSIIVYDFGL